MPAPGGNFAGARSDSRGYAGNGPSSSRSGAGGAGGVRNSSSGTRESAGSQARSSGGSTGNTSRGGNSLGGGLNGPSRSGSNGGGNSRPGAGSGPSRSGSNGGGRGLGGLASAARDAYGGGSRDGGLGGVGNVGRGNYQGYSGPKGVGALNQGARMAAARSVGWNAPAVNATAAEIDLMARTMLAESSSIRNAFGRPNVGALQAVGDVVRNRALSEKFPDTIGGVVTQKGQFSPFNKDKSGRRPIDTFTKAHPDFKSTRAIAESILSGETPSVVGNSLNFGNMHTINSKKGYSSKATQRAFNSMNVERTFADAKNPNTRQHSFGTIGTSDVAFNGPRSAQPTSQFASASSPGASQRVAEFASRGKPATGASSRVAEFAGRGKPALAGSSRVAEFAARGKPAVPTSFSAGRAQEIPTPNEISRPWERAQPIPTPRERHIAGLPNPSGYSFGPGGPIRTAEPARSYAMASPNIEPASGPGFSLPGLGKINNVMQRAKASVAPLANMAWDNLNNPLLGLMRSPSRPRSRSGGDTRTREVQRLVAALTGRSVAPLDFSVTET